ncbi:uncharacterized protein DS421_17g588010 [Arachis hypogaea]|nr:uncharacterized protein DS421_17g588010 [Arachis hypogaea]
MFLDFSPNLRISDSLPLCHSLFFVSSPSHSAPDFLRQLLSPSSSFFFCTAPCQGHRSIRRAPHLAEENVAASESVAVFLIPESVAVFLVLRHRRQPLSSGIGEDDGCLIVSDLLDFTSPELDSNGNEQAQRKQQRGKILLPISEQNLQREDAPSNVGVVYNGLEYVIGTAENKTKERSGMVDSSPPFLY